jgi:hypothetical protein
MVGPTIDQRFRVKAFSFRFKRLDGGACSSSIASLLPWYCVAKLDEFVQYRRHTCRLQVQTQSSVLHFRRLGLDGPDRSFGGVRARKRAMLRIAG